MFGWLVVGRSVCLFVYVCPSVCVVVVGGGVVVVVVLFVVVCCRRSVVGCLFVCVSARVIVRWSVRVVA